MTDTETAVTYDVTDAVATITMNRPDAMNSFDHATKIAVRDALTHAGTDDSVRCVVVTGTGRAFSAGQDLKEHLADIRSGKGPLSTTVKEHYNPMVRAILTMPKPVIAAVNGVAAGAGASLAFAADFRIVADSAGFNLAFAAIALSCDTGASWTLPRLIGLPKAKELMFRPRTVKAAEALELGIATEVVPDAEFANTVRARASELAAGPTLAYASLKRALAYSSTHDVDESLAYEATLMGITGDSADHRDAVEAFVAKQKPTFHGR